MLYEDKWGHLLLPEQVDDLSSYEIEELGIHVADDIYA